MHVVLKNEKTAEEDEHGNGCHGNGCHELPTVCVAYIVAAVLTADGVNGYHDDDDDNDEGDIADGALC